MFTICFHLVLGNENTLCSDSKAVLIKSLKVIDLEFQK